MPLVHHNSIDPLGMRCKNDYLIYREKNGFFTALCRKDKTIKTWSLATGKLLHEANVDNNLFGSASLSDYSKYQAGIDDDENDIIPPIDNYDCENRSISLIVKDVNANEYS